MTSTTSAAWRSVEEEHRILLGAETVQMMTVLSSVCNITTYPIASKFGKKMAIGQVEQDP